MRVSSVSEMRALDRTAIEQYGIVEELLMENAGQAVYFVVLNEFGIEGRHFLVFCGLGNNGGDGLVVARKIHSSGGTVKVVVLGDPSRYKGAARLNFDIVSRLPIEVQRLESAEALKADITRCDAIVDAILGTGITRNVEGLYRDVVDSINRGGKPVFSIDIPSGVHGDTGQVMGTAVRADYTVTFGLPKLGNVLFPGCELGGKLYVSHISFPPSMTAANHLKVEISRPLEFPARRRDTVKGRLRRVLFIVGAAGHHQAAYSAVTSYLNAGGGHCWVAAPGSIAPFLANMGSGVAFLAQDETGTGSIAHSSKADLLEVALGMDLVVLGPGLSQEAETQGLVRELAAEIEKPLLIDGDGITVLLDDHQIIEMRAAESILMVLLDEMAGFTGTDVGEAGGSRIELLRRTARELGATMVLKGVHSLVGHADERLFVNMSGCPNIEKGIDDGMLAGTIAAMYAVGLSLKDAVRQGVFVHGLACEFAGSDKGDGGTTAQGILEHLPEAVMVVRKGLNERIGDRYPGARVI